MLMIQIIQKEQERRSKLKADIAMSLQQDRVM